MERLSHGLNISSWWTQPESVEDMVSRVREDDLDKIQQAGFDHVRIALDPYSLWDGGMPVILNKKKVAAFIKCLDQVLDHGLAAIVTVTPGVRFGPILPKTAPFDRYRSFLLALAGAMRDTDPDRVFLEVLDVTAVGKAQEWHDEMTDAIEWVRPMMPKHTLIIPGRRDVAIDSAELEPLADRDVIYAFHFSDPFPFTHQGYAALAGPVRFLKNVPYPSSPTNVAPLLPDLDNDQSKKTLHDYGKDRWDADSLEKALKGAAEWARDHKVRLLCDEFGVTAAAPKDARKQYLKDVVAAFAHQHVGWTLDDFSGTFSVANGSPGSKVFDPDVVQALSLSHP